MIGLAIFLIVPPFLPMYVQSIVTKVAVFAIFAMSLDLIMGYTGLLSLGHAAFFGVGGYMAAILIKNFEITNFWIVAPISIVVAALFAAVLGLIALRVTGIYFLLVTFALSMLLASIALKWNYVNGIYGMAGIMRPDLGLAGFRLNHIKFYYFVFLILIVCYFLMYRVVNSPFGHALRGIRESESRMRALGYNTWLYKYIAFIIAGLFAGVGGVLFTYQSGVIAPQHLGVTVSTLAMLICIIGGIGTLWGPLIGALVIILLEYISSINAPERWPLILGGVFVISVMFLKGGIAFHLKKLWNKMFLNGSFKD
jgi:branched-chain amino acid transport system permease protein